MGVVIAPRVMKHFSEHPGVDLYLSDIAADLKLSPRQIQSCITNINHRTSWPNAHPFRVQTVVRGQVYRYSPPSLKETLAEIKAEPPKKATLYQFVGAARDGTIVLERDDGVLFRASEL